MIIGSNFISLRLQIEKALCDVSLRTNDLLLLQKVGDRIDRYGADAFITAAQSERIAFVIKSQLPNAR